MTSKYQTFFAVNFGIVGACYLIYTEFRRRYNEGLYKRSTIFKEAMEILKSHKGAIHLLGDFIEDGRLTVMNEEKEGDNTKYHVKVAVRGCDGQGNMYFWVTRKDQDEFAQLDRIELKLQNMNKRLLVLDRNKSEIAETEVPAL